VLTIARHNLLHLARSRELLVLSVAQPIMFVLLFDYVLGGAIATPGTAYLDFLIPGQVVDSSPSPSSRPALASARTSPMA
jgi:ABC-2 type transport system permease protein